MPAFFPCSPMASHSFWQWCSTLAAISGVPVVCNVGPSSGRSWQQERSALLVGGWTGGSMATPSLGCRAQQSSAVHGGGSCCDAALVMDSMLPSRNRRPDGSHLGGVWMQVVPGSFSQGSAATCSMCNFLMWCAALAGLACIGSVRVCQRQLAGLLPVAAVVESSAQSVVLMPGCSCVGNAIPQQICCRHFWACCSRCQSWLPRPSMRRGLPQYVRSGW
jgi:hypothetical protein